MDKGLKLVKEREGRKVDNTLYNKIVGILMYLTTTRADVMHVVSLISRFIESPKEMHIQASKRIMWYLTGTSDLGIIYKIRVDGDLVCYTDSKYGVNLVDKKST